MAPRKKAQPPTEPEPAAMPDPAAEQWRGKKEELLLVSAAADRELDDATSRDGSMRARATILIGAASVVGAIQLGDDFDFFLVISLLLSLLAAIFGVVVVFPRSSGAFNPRTMWDELYAGGEVEEALHHMVRIKLKSLDREDKSLGIRSGFARAGFILLVLAIVFAALSAVLPDGLAGLCLCPAPSPTSTP
jgi:hypothetical protein